ncbi:acyl carrier protein [Micromonospora sp. PTRAS2]
MAHLTIPMLLRILDEVAGADSRVDFDRDVTDVPFEELGYDSLALLEASARIRQETGIDLGDKVALVATPRELLGLAQTAV